MNIPLMSISGNFMRVEVIIVVAGMSVGGYDDRSMLRAEKHSVARIKLRIRDMKFIGFMFRVNVRVVGISVIRNPKMNDDNMSPSRIAHRATGQHRSLSRVFALASHGIIAGPTDVAVKKAVMLISFDNISFMGISLPMV